MKINDVSIGKLLKIGFAILMLFVVVLGAIAYYQTDQIHRQTEIIYNHPFQVRRAIGSIKANVLMIHRDMKNLFIALDDKEISQDLSQIENWKYDVFKNIDILYSQYLGPKSDIDSLKNAFIVWNSMREETIRILRSGDIKTAAYRTKNYGVAGNQVNILLQTIQKIDEFSKNKSDKLYKASDNLHDSLANQLILITVIILVLSFLINYFLLGAVLKPTKELTIASKRFQDGDMNVRSTNISKNEFGVLSDSFNKMVESIQVKSELDKKFTDLATLLISEHDIKKFFQSLLNALALNTGSQMAAIYLLSENKKTFEHFESLGLDENSRKSFSAENFDGEFGIALASQEVHHLKQVPDDTRFIFNTVVGQYIPKEIITIPVLANNEVIAVISLSSLDEYSQQDIALINRMQITLSNRIEGILSTQKIKEISDELLRAGAYTRSLIEASIDSFVTIDINGKITDVNKSTEEIIGLSREELIGTEVADYFTYPDHARAGYEKVFREGVVKDYELTILNQNGSTIPVLFNAAVYRDEKNKVIGVFAAARDITEQKKVEKELINLNLELINRSQKLELANLELESQKTELASQSAELLQQNSELEMQKTQLSEASRLKTNFLSNMSHELRTPLNSVIALSGVLSRRLTNKISEEESSYLEVIERNGKQLLNLINDILDISRIEAGREEIEITKFNPCTLVKEVINMIHPQAKQKNIELYFAEGDCDVDIICDERKFRHILQNLIGNAVKFTESGKVEITAVKRLDKIAISIKDTGIGISDENISHIFDEFRQADGSTSRRFGGSGLGLSIAKKYAKLLGGTISVKSKFGVGSEFTLTLPLLYSSENKIVDELQFPKIEQMSKFTHNIPTINPVNKTILLVEDSEPAIIQLKDFLEESGYNILVARDGGTALEIITYTIPDAIILDLMMPDVDGFEVLKKVREFEVTSKIPVLILTAKHITKEELNFLKSNNIKQLIQKGDVNRNELLNVVSSMVNPPVIEIEQSNRKIQTIDGKPIVLVVEDNPDNMMTAKAILADNYIVLEAVDGITGIEMAENYLPNLILMDIALPVLDGITAFQAIRNNARLLNIPVIALTASAMVSDRETILAYGFDAYIAKPIDEKIFFKTINEVLYGK